MSEHFLRPLREKNKRKYNNVRVEKHTNKILKEIKVDAAATKCKRNWGL